MWYESLKQEKKENGLLSAGIRKIDRRKKGMENRKYY
jgi:hypothetical protein